MQTLSKMSGLPAVALALSLACVAPAFAETYTYYPSPGQNFTTVAGSADGSGIWYTLYCIDVGSLQPGDILVIAGESQIQQSSATSAILVSSEIARTSLSSCAEIAEAGYLFPGGTALTGANGYNVTVNEYRGVSPKPANITVQTGDGATNAAIVYNVHVSADMDVPANTGGLQVLKIRP